MTCVLIRVSWRLNSTVHHFYLRRRLKTLFQSHLRGHSCPAPTCRAPYPAAHTLQLPCFHSLYSIPLVIWKKDAAKLRRLRNSLRGSVVGGLLRSPQPGGAERPIQQRNNVKVAQPRAGSHSCHGRNFQAPRWLGLGPIHSMSLQCVSGDTDDVGCAVALVDRWSFPTWSLSKHHTEFRYQTSNNRLYFPLNVQNRKLTNV